MSRTRALAPRRVIKTLDPSRLHPSDYVHLAGIQTKLSALDSTFELGYRQLREQNIPFPPGSLGFLYLSSCPDEPESTWQIRFRLADSDSLQSFRSGADLLLPDHKPWSIPLRYLGSKKYATLWELLVREGSVCSALFKPKPYYAGQTIKTLDPSLLQASDHLNIAGFTKSQISTPGSSFEITYYSQNGNRVRFPDDARGFLYLHSPAEEPKAKWEIRFCITNSDNNCPSSFKSGLDLLFPNQTPWAISLSSTKARSHPLRELLIREGLDIDALAHIPSVKTVMSTSRPLIYSLGQRFCLNFKNTTFQPIFISFGGEEKLDCYIEFLSRHRGPSPYIGMLYVTSLGLC
ncbi:hypothetical protein FIBSPDRAFT_21735 [Athelia psychrophila]|uniref:Uncharacterized protein n=1 Tax=Athelia psychrophila TaxID=1759441 RepID=A0A166GDI0_9AGAM|nr:hypothetical protein FIBSPDRAFT_21735 [Fibularhizoctonia sp. CBS 109695]